MPAAPDPWRAERRVPLRLAAAEGQPRLSLKTAAGSPLEVWREGDAVRADGGRFGPWLRLDDPGGGWRLGDRLYPGDLLVEVRSGGGLRLSAWLDLEEYVRGVVAAEVVLWDAPQALLEAQAIAARSYAVAQLDQRAAAGPRPSLVDSVLDQAFRGRYEPTAAEKNRGVDRRLDAALAATAGWVLEHRGRVLDARFHAACGGHTAAFADVFPEPDPGAMTAVPCPPCQADPSAWSYTVSAGVLARIAQERGLGAPLVSPKPMRLDNHGRWLEIELVGRDRSERIPAGELRRAVGWQQMRSSAVRRTWPAPGETIAGGLFLEGVGHGHGVGLCQTGARRMAAAGRSSETILAHYYPGARLGRMAVRR